jgi:hypothetical protein
MNSGLRPRVFLLTVATALGLIVGASAAVAAGLNVGKKNVAVGPNPAQGTATAKCPKGQKVVSGGFSSLGFNPNYAVGPSVLPFASFMAGKASWTAAGRNASASPGTLKVMAFCAPSVGKINTRSTDVQVPPGTSATAATRCPSGQKIVAGGTDSPGFSTPGPRVYPFRSYKAGGGWRAAAFNTGNAVGTLRVFAYCAAYTGLSKKSKSGTIGPNFGTGTVKAQCNGLMIAGGFKTPTYSPTGTAILPTTSRKGGASGWKVSAVNNGALTQAGKLTVFAYCLK